jgi:protein-L-isoaspartate(D-aspartate) O-methyltransferase
MVDQVRRALSEEAGNRELDIESVLRAMAEVERHRFVPAELADRAYLPQPLPIGQEQTISSPYIVGLMTALLDLEGDEKVLEIGTGSGYQAAVLSRLVPRVLTIEIREGLAASARERLARLGYANVVVRCGDGYGGWPEEAPFDAIVVTAAPPAVPSALVEQLAPGGRIVVPVGGRDANQELKLGVKKADGSVAWEKVSLVRFVPMIRDR